MGNVDILVGAQWGDEGKGKWIDILAADSEVVVRFQGGNNAGHTLYRNGEKVVLHQIPSGIFQDQQICALSAGVVLNPTELVAEMDKLTAFCQLDPATLWLSEKAHVITPWHIYQDTLREQRSKRPIGTTKRGIGPTYAEKASRLGLRLGDYVNEHKFSQWIDLRIDQSDEFKTFYEENRDLWHQFSQAAPRLQPFVCDAERALRQLIKKGKKVLLEGAQGALLDLDHGTYPYVTSSSTSVGGAYASLGFSPRSVGQIYGVAKAYLTRVGEGPFPTELSCEVGRFLAEKGNEKGATTGRPRRCGWLDMVAMRYVQEVNGFDGFILNKLDVMTGLKEIKICVAYEHPKLGRIDDFPSDHEVLAACQPIYESFSGWETDIPKSGSRQDLPEEALAYVEAVERLCGTRVCYVGTGVHRSDYLS